MKRYSRSVVVALIFLIVFISHFFSKNLIFCDSIWSIYTAKSIVKERNTDLDEYQEILEKNGYYAIEKIHGHFYTMFSVGVSVIAAPLVCLLDSFHIDATEIPLKVESFIASLMVAMASIFIYLISGLFLNKGYSLLITFIFAFCTSTWSTASRALWQHGPSILMLTIIIYLVLQAEKKPWLIILTGLPLAFSYVIRPTNSLSIILLSIFIFIKYRRFFVFYLLSSLIIIIPFLLFNLSTYHALLSPYYLAGRLCKNPDFFEALLGNFFSPSRGLFIFSPIFLLSIAGIILKIRRKQFTILDYILLAIILSHWVVISSCIPWWAGHSIGPRYFVDMIPYLIYFLIVAFKLLSEKEAKISWGIAFSLICLVLISISFFANFRGANIWAVHAWNAEPVNVDLYPARVWDWSDIQFLRGIK